MFLKTDIDGNMQINIFLHYLKKIDFDKKIKQEIWIPQKKRQIRIFNL